jgi:hypothetical protein
VTGAAVLPSVTLLGLGWLPAWLASRQATPASTSPTGDAPQLAPPAHVRALA